MLIRSVLEGLDEPSATRFSRHITGRSENSRSFSKSPSTDDDHKSFSKSPSTDDDHRYDDHSANPLLLMMTIVQHWNSLIAGYQCLSTQLSIRSMGESAYTSQCAMWPGFDNQNVRDIECNLDSGYFHWGWNPMACVLHLSCFILAAVGRVCLDIQIYGENSSCAGRALRNIIIVQAADLVKDRVNLKGFYRRSCVGSELVDWLLEHCPFVQCRSMAIGVWQLLLDMGIMSSVDQHLYFQDNYVFYQFSTDECSYLYCEFEREEEWQNGVKLLLQLVHLVPDRAGTCDLSHQKVEDSEESSDEILARLTSAVQRELAAVIALKARKS
ncbi:hypothetical protein STEG23_030103, partial [Scotinomys teguina]